MNTTNSTQIEDLERLRHSAAHVVAAAVLRKFPDAKIATGPATQDGFYYDFLLQKPLTPRDLTAIEQIARNLLSAGLAFEKEVVSIAKARSLFADQPYKLWILEALDKNAEVKEISIYRTGDFVDLCRGPHVPTTSDIPIDGFKLLSTSAAHSKIDPEGPMLQRISGTAFASAEDLEHFEWLRAEAARRDHRRLGKELRLFHLDKTAPGMPYWLPDGLKMMNTLLDFWRHEHERLGYQEISSPLINHRSLWETSGHWDFYRDDMFVIQPDDSNAEPEYAVKPMNCPNAMVVFGLETRSYRDLPIKLSDCDALHRNERSGALHGLLRVQKVQQDDAHIFIEADPEQIREQYQEIFDICDRFYGIFGLDYQLRLGTRPEKFVGDLETWNVAEGVLRNILDSRKGKGNYWVEEGDGAFYGPKIDIIMTDALERPWQMGTIQLDFNLPKRFNLRYAAQDGSLQTPVVVHRVIYGSLERFMGILIEHTAGSFPLWLSAKQVEVVPVTKNNHHYAQQVVEKFRQAGIRTHINRDDDSLGARIRETQKAKTPVVVVVGDHEEEGNTVSVRLRGQRNSLPEIPIDEAIAAITSASRSLTNELERSSFGVEPLSLDNLG